jgi:hypothetical protein
MEESAYLALQQLCIGDIKPFRKPPVVPSAIHEHLAMAVLKKPGNEVKTCTLAWYDLNVLTMSRVDNAMGLTPLSTALPASS